MAFSKAIAAALKKKKKKKKVEKVEVDAAEKKPITKRQFKKDYEVDIGKPNPTDRTIRDMPQRKVRGTSGKAADAGSDPIVVGRKSMPSFADVNAASGAKKSRLKAKLKKLADDGSDIAAARLKRIQKAEADTESGRVRKSAITRAGRKPDEAGTYLNEVTGQVVTIKGSKGISAKERFLPLDYPGAKKSDYIKNPTKQEEARVERSIRAKKRLEKSGDTPEKDLKRAKEKAKTEKLKKIVKTTEDPKFKRLDITKGLTDAEKKKLGLKQGGMAMKKKGYAKGGMKKKKGMARGGAMMKKKGMAMGGLKKPAAGQTGLKKLPTPVRNKMGYMAKGGMKKKGMAMGGMKKKGYAMGGMRVKYKVGGMVKGKTYGSVDNRKKK